MNKTILFVPLLLILVLAFSCKNPSGDNKTQSHTEILEIYDVKGDTSSYEADQLQHYQSEYYRDGRLTETIFYNPDKTVKGKEVYVYAKYATPMASEYYSPNGKLLSYYRFIHNKKGDKIMSMGFDNSNDELLRIETFTYDDKGNMVTKEIRDNAMKIDRVYYFNYDEDGNQIGMSVLDQDEKVILSEFFRITEFDEENKWKEKWGFVNKVPKTFHVRK